MKLWVHFKLVVEVEDAEDLDDAWDQATESLRDGGGDIIGHTICDKNGAVKEEAP
jgi:hypothetical protein